MRKYEIVKVKYKIVEKRCEIVEEKYEIFGEKLNVNSPLFLIRLKLCTFTFLFVSFLKEELSISFVKNYYSLTGLKPIHSNVSS